MKRKILKRSAKEVDALVVAVTGGRNITDYAYVSYHLDDVQSAFGISKLLYGDAKGVDASAGRWALINCVEKKCFLANWKEQKQAAGHIRNSAILEDKPDLLLVFEGGKGTANMKQQAIKRNIPLINVKKSTTITRDDILKVRNKFDDLFGKLS